MNLPFGAQGLQPGDEQLAHLLLSQQLANLAGDFCERDIGSPGLLQLGDKLVAVVSLNGLGIDLDGGTKASIDEAHQIDLLPDAGEKIFFREVASGEKGLPGLAGRGFWIELTGLGDAGRGFGVGGMEKVGGLHLLAKKFLVDKTIENRAAIVVVELSQGAIGEKSLVEEGFIPVGLQNNAAVHGGDDAADT